MALASCQDLAEAPGPGEGMAELSGYPSLHTVPPRPQLSYTVEQRRVVIDGLIADRENARYSDQVVRYRTGLSGLPPPEAPPVAATPPTTTPDEPNVGDVSSPPRTARDRPVVDPGTEFTYEDDDDLDTFLEGLTGGRIEAPGQIAPGPESNVAPLGTAIVRAGAARPVSAPAAAYDGPPPGVVWAIPVDTAGLPEAPRATAPSAAATGEAKSPPPAAGTAIAGRAPGVVWGIVGAPQKPAGPAAGAAQTANERDESVTVAAARGPADAGPTETTKGTGQGRQPNESAMTGRAPGVVWGMVDTPEKPAAPAAVETAAQVAGTTASVPAVAPVLGTPAAAPPRLTNGQNGTSDRNERSVEPAVALVAERSDRRPPYEPHGAAPGIEVADGLIALAPASRVEPAPAEEAIAFAPGSAALPPDAAARLERFLAEVKAPEVRIRVVGAADAPALALDRALAVGVALVQLGVPADRLEMTLAQGAAGDQARLSLAPSPP